MTSGARSGKRLSRLAILVVAVMSAAACGKHDKDPAAEPSKPATESDLTAFELENGIGPVKEAVVVGTIDPALARKGHELFEAKCSMCHKMDTTYVGPSLGEVTKRRTSTYIMNMILNPQEMVERHPIAKKLLAERMTFMANQGLKVEEARAVVEYLRTQAKGAGKP